MDKTSPLSGNSDMEGGLSLQKIPGGMEISIFLAPLWLYIKDYVLHSVQKCSP